MVRLTAGGIPRQLWDVTCWRMTVRLGRDREEGRYESIVLVLFLCILLVVTIVDIMDYLTV